MFNKALIYLIEEEEAAPEVPHVVKKTGSRRMIKRIRTGAGIGAGIGGGILAAYNMVATNHLYDKAPGLYDGSSKVKEIIRAGAGEGLKGAAVGAIAGGLGGLAYHASKRRKERKASKASNFSSKLEAMLSGEMTKSPVAGDREDSTHSNDQEIASPVKSKKKYAKFSSFKHFPYQIGSTFLVK